MRKETSEWTIKMLVDFKSRINTDAEFQRGKVWSVPQQALLIDSILRGFDIPKIYVRKLPSGRQHLFDVIDGKQRLTAIWKFLSDDFMILRNSDDFPRHGNLSGKRWSELPATAQDELQFAHITVSAIEEASEEETREFFLRLQRGEPLNSAEKRNAMAGPIRDFVAAEMVPHDFWKLTNLRTERFGIDEHAAILLAIVINGGPTALKGADLQALYQSENFDPSGSDAQQAVCLLQMLREVASHGENEIRTRWGLVDLAIAIMRAEQEGIRTSPESIMEFFRTFEQHRRDVANTISDFQTDLVETTLEQANDEGYMEIPEIAPDMLAYHLAFSREGATQENVKSRSDIMYNKLAEHLLERA